MQTELYSLSKIFTENLFRIPDYQRGYSWGERQLKDFWSDLTLLEEGRDHYTGVLTLEEVNSATIDVWTEDLWIISSKRYKPYYVVDGQQRLTTSLILLQAILEKLSPTGELNYSTFDEIRKKYIYESRDHGVSRSYIFGYEKDNPSYEYLKTKVFMEPSDAHSSGEETIYTQNLLAAKTFFSEQLESLDHVAMEMLYTKLTQHFLFNIYVISGAIDVFVAFETMNNRGKALSHLELLKNRLIFLSTRLKVDDHERGQLRRTINESWKTAYHFLGRNRKRPLQDDDFLSTQFLLYIGTRVLGAEGRDERKEVRQVWRMHHHDEEYKSYLLEKYFSSRNLREPLEEKQNQNSTLRLTAETLYEYAHDLKRCVETYYRLLNPDDSEFCDISKVQLERLRRLGWREALPLAVAAVHQASSHGELAPLFERIERLNFIKSIALRGEDDEVDLIEAAVQMARGEKSIEAISEEIHTFADKVAAKLDVRYATMRWGRERAYYGWGGLKYFLYEYEQELRLKSRSDRQKLDWEEFTREKFDTDYSTIEHVYPQKPRSEYWSERFGSFTVKQRNAIRNSLGNLLALSKRKNSTLNNKSFPEKRDGSVDAGGYRFGSYSEIEVTEESEWTAQVIARRGVRLLEFMERRWSLNLGDEKLQTLGIAFLQRDSNSQFQRDNDSDGDEIDDDIGSSDE